MKKFSFGIRAQLIAGIVVTTIAGIGLIGLLSIKIVENSLVFGRLSEAERIVKVIKAASRAQSTQSPQSNDDAIRFTTLALKEAGISDFRITGVSGRQLAYSGTLEPAEGERISFNGDINVTRVGAGWFSGAGRLLYIKTPLGPPGRNIGTLEFTLRLSEIGESMSAVRKFLLFYAAIDSIIIIFIGIYFLSGSIIKPVKKLEEAAKRVAGGKLGERAEVDVDNEIGSLAASFNTMAERLEDEIKSLERVNLELMTAQEELTRSSTLAAVGRLAAGLAHEIGNPLGAVRGYLDILSMSAAGKEADKEEDKEVLQRASKEVARIDAIVREFLEVARPAKRPVEPVDVNSVIEDTLSAASARDEFDGVEVIKDLDRTLPPVRVEESKLRQVFMNLLINAAQSFDGRAGAKTITVETSARKRLVDRRMGRRKDDRPIETETVEGREFVFIRFTDNGPGISEQDARKVFDPFFTTKEVGKGTGLGLFISQTIIKACGGAIDLETRHGEGSTFTVALPADRET